MSQDGPREQFLRDPPQQRLERLAAHFERIASCIRQRQPETALAETLRQTRAFCEWAAAEERSTSVKQLLLNVTMALQTLQAVWPRMGTQREFRLAVAREADLWSRRLPTLSGDARG